MGRHKGVVSLLPAFPLPSCPVFLIIEDEAGNTAGRKSQDFWVKISEVMLLIINNAKNCHCYFIDKLL